MRLSVEGFSHSYRWDVRVHPDRDTDLGALILGPATGIVGWVTVAKAGPADGVEVRVKPRLGRQPTAVARRPSGAILTHEATTDRRGFFQVQGLAPGPIVVILQNGGMESADYLLRTWSRLHGGELPSEGDPGRYVLPQLAPGHYQVCLADPRLLDMIASTGAPHGRCSGGVLADGGELTLTVAGPDGQSP